jgi:hypothetical protein
VAGLGRAGLGRARACGGVFGWLGLGLAVACLAGLGLAVACLAGLGRARLGRARQVKQNPRLVWRGFWLLVVT